jgi:sugar phosphate isomerase/epimerase
MRRRDFLATLPAAAAAAAAPAGLNLGVDLFSLRSQKWTAFEHLEYCSKLGARTVHFSEIRFLGSLDDGHVREVGEQARRLGIELEIGMRSICPGSAAFDRQAGTAEEQLLRVMRAARIAGSKLVRAFLGTFQDRRSAGGIEARIGETVQVLKNVRPQALDMGLKIAVENHAGDMQSRELRKLIEAAGPDFVGACYDSGNPCWVLEDPHQALETLAPYVLTSHIRDSYLWNDAEGTQVNWTRSGEGNVDIGRLMKRFVELCPGKAMSLEVIVMGPRAYPWRKPEFWQGYENVRAADFARFLDIAARGVPQPPRPAVAKERAAELEREDLEASMRWTRSHLGLGGV